MFSAIAFTYGSRRTALQGEKGTVTCTSLPPCLRQREAVLWNGICCNCCCANKTFLWTTRNCFNREGSPFAVRIDSGRRQVATHLDILSTSCRAYRRSVDNELQMTKPHR
ncbi:hypothetical protein M404DRAFT_212295 [Pisolithus tinctorius Marx 270]|uniref:Uncharacterized protein n=1 Tax=Pisolithus tinctorius Marx 270 TaxID=870435 RepID=A0A0C3PZG4_PISTI|nr:hypothetical protein M404DRAFT_212295 [Pisolithus tinctorius Marx 270]